MPRYTVPIEAWVEVNADDAEQAWQIAMANLSNPVRQLIENLGKGGVSIGEPVEEEQNG